MVEVRLKGHACGQWIKDSKLTVNSHPFKWVDAFLPTYNLPKKTKNNTPYMLLVDKLSKWSNKKAQLM